MIRRSAGARPRLPDQISFLKNWVGRPRTTGAVSPSGQALARLVASHVDPADPHKVLELGPGTGVFTRALIARGIAPERIVTIEYSPDFCRMLRTRLPEVNVIQGDAYDLAGTLPEDEQGPFSAVVSGLPLVLQKPAKRLALVEQALDRLVPGGVLIQFSYSLVPPVPPQAGRFTTRPSRWVVANLPPARVWLYRRVA